MNRRLMRWLEQWHILGPSQFGFRSGHEVVDACSQLAKDIVAAFRHGEVVQAVTLDIQSAYDTVWREELIRKLEVIGMDPYIEMFLDRTGLSKTVDRHGTERCHVLSRSSRFLAAVLFEQHPVLVE